MSHIARSARYFAVATALIVLFAGSAAAQQHITGTLSDGATYVIDVPASWNGTLLLYSHGYVAPGSSNPAQDVGDPLTGAYLLAAGYALAGSSRIDRLGGSASRSRSDFDARRISVGCRHSVQTIAWRHSLGGEVTAALVQQYPARFAAAQPMCGVLSGTVGFWNQHLDGAFAFNTLLAGGSLQVIHITNPTLNVGTAEAILAAAQAAPQGQARLALVSALIQYAGLVRSDDFGTGTD